MFSIRKAAIGVAALAIAGIGFVSTPAAQAVGETCTVVAQTASVSSDYSPKGGLYYPATDPGVAGSALSGGPGFIWSLNGTCADTGLPFTSSGAARGWCGRSVGDGSGQVNGRSFTIHWESAGSMLVMTDPSAFGGVNAQPNPPGTNGSCLDGSASAFLVSGTLVNFT